MSKKPPINIAVRVVKAYISKSILPTYIRFLRAWLHIYIYIFFFFLFLFYFIHSIYIYIYFIFLHISCCYIYLFLYINKEKVRTLLVPVCKSICKFLWCAIVCDCSCTWELFTEQVEAW